MDSREALACLRPFLNVVSGKLRFPDCGSSMISGFIELTTNSFGRNWTIQMPIQLSIYIRVQYVLMDVGLCRKV